MCMVIVSRKHTSIFQSPISLRSSDRFALPHYRRTGDYIGFPHTACVSQKIVCEPETNQPACQTGVHMDHIMNLEGAHFTKCIFFFQVMQ